MKDKLLEIINNYGIMPQLKYFQSEVFELNEAIIKERNTNYFGKAENYMEDINHITEEIADCYVMIEQFRLYYNIPKDEIKEIMEQKIDRQISRIAKEKE